MRGTLQPLSPWHDPLRPGLRGRAFIPAGDVRLQRIEKALNVLLEKDLADRAAKIQQIFSLEYDSNWKVPQPR